MFLTKADEYLCRDIENIKKRGTKDINPRPKWSDGSSAHTYFVTHVQRTYNLSKGEFPITTLRPIAWKSAIKEILWIYQDQSNDLELLRNKYNINWWNDFESKDIPGTIGNRYGHTVKKYDLMNKRVLDDIKNVPYSRYHIMNLWQEDELNSSDGLKPCAFETIWTVRGEYLDMFLNQRSGDMLVASGAGCVNEVQYAALLMMVADSCHLRPGKFTHFVANEQIYDRHLNEADELLSRYKKRISMDGDSTLPKMKLNHKESFYDFTIDDFSLDGYTPVQPQLKFEVAI